MGIGIDIRTDIHNQQTTETVGLCGDSKLEYIDEAGAPCRQVLWRKQQQETNSLKKTLLFRGLAAGAIFV